LNYLLLLVLTLDTSRFSGTALPLSGLKLGFSRAGIMYFTNTKKTKLVEYIRILYVISSKKKE